MLLAGCAAAPAAPEGASEVRAKLTQLQSDSNLASRAPVAIKEADAAVRTAEQPEADRALGEHRVYIADRKVEIASAQAQTRYLEDQRAQITAERASAQLDSRTREVDVAREATADANEENAELQRQIDALKAKPTDRGLVLTLGDVLFESGRAELKAGATSNLGQLVTFLAKYPSRTVAIEGHTDSVGGDDYNLGLSQRRADSVRSIPGQPGRRCCQGHRHGGRRGRSGRQQRIRCRSPAESSGRGHHQQSGARRAVIAGREAARNPRSSRCAGFLCRR